jgi:hypothetical protein
MFASNQFASEERLSDMDAMYLSWVKERLADGRYLGLLMDVSCDASTFTS